jgi:AcrR family transcriptional regulator
MDVVVRSALVDRAKRTKKPAVDLRGARDRAREAEQRAVLDAAGALLQSEGPGALSVRRLAQLVGASTTVVYTHFGGKDALLGALYRDALEQMGQAMARRRAPDPLSLLGELAQAYRRFALAHRALYAVLSAAWGAEEGRAAQQIREGRPYRLLHDAVARCLEAGLLRGSSAAALADVMWANVHGLVSLELAGYFSSEQVAKERFEESGKALVRGFAA